MAFSTIAASEVDADSPITDTLMNTIRTNFDDHETRILAATEAGAITTRVTEVGGFSGGAWVTIAESLIWVPAGITKLYAHYRLDRNLGTLKVRMLINATSGTEYTVNSGSGWQDGVVELTVDSGDKAAWMILEHQGWSNDASAKIHKDMETISGVQRDYGAASYWQ